MSSCASEIACIGFLSLTSDTAALASASASAPGGALVSIIAANVCIRHSKLIGSRIRYLLRPAWSAPVGVVLLRVFYGIFFRTRRSEQVVVWGKCGDAIASVSCRRPHRGHTIQFALSSRSSLRSSAICWSPARNP